ARRVRRATGRLRRRGAVGSLVPSGALAGGTGTLAGRVRRADVMRDAKGRFLPGPGPSRHVLTRAERRERDAPLMSGRGRRCQDPDVLAWAWRKVRAYYRARRRRGDCAA